MIRYGNQIWYLDAMQKRPANANATSLPLMLRLFRGQDFSRHFENVNAVLHF
jgi:hypothetical protein